VRDALIPVAAPATIGIEFAVMLVALKGNQMTPSLPFAERPE
jgi:hypothetical protein